MRVLSSSVGTRGDVQPAIALALQVREQGHEARLCVSPNFVDWARGLGFEARPMGVEMRPPPPGAAPPVIPDLISDQFDVVEPAAQDCDVIVGAGGHQYAARSIAELRGVPCVVAVYAPVSLPNTQLAPAGDTAGARHPDEISRLWESHRRRWNERSRERLNDNRERRGLSPIDEVLDHILGERPWLACDAALGPAPSGSNLDFLEAGDPPVYLGLGSMPVADEVGQALIEATRAVGRRAILSEGWAGLSLADEGVDCLLVGDVNHQALFPRVAAVMHHGGAGTTLAAALAGAPQVVSPLFSDQFYWGARVRELGAGAVARGGGQDVSAMASALETALGSTVAEGARRLAGQVRGDGAEVAARWLAQMA
jgi:vancomycin aglycone glucosyltransferase